MFEITVIIICVTGFITLFILDMAKKAFFFRYFSPLFLIPIIVMFYKSGLPKEALITDSNIGGIAFIASVIIGILYVVINNSGRRRVASLHGGSRPVNIFSEIYLGLIFFGLTANIYCGTLVCSFKTYTHTEECEAVITSIRTEKAKNDSSVWEEEKNIISILTDLKKVQASPFQRLSKKHTLQSSARKLKRVTL